MDNNLEPKKVEVVKDNANQVDDKTVELSSHKKFLYWVVKHRFYVFSILASIVFLNVIIFKVKPLFVKKVQEGSFLAKEAYDDWKKAFFKDEKKLNELKNIMTKNPNLKPNYEGLIYQDLIMSGNLKKEEVSIEKTLKRTKGDLPLFYEYSQVALLINDGKYEDALKKSRDLKSKLFTELSKEGKASKGSSFLYSLNLLRIALLEGKLNNAVKELVAWKELQDYLNLAQKADRNEAQSVSKMFKEIFSENGIELIDYIREREQKISSIKH